MTESRGAIRLAVIVAALGYFVDIYDLLLFGIVRKTSLLSIGVAEKDLLDVGARLQNWQMGAMLIGGVLWGVLGDRRGRLSVLFGSILLYSTANIANSFVHTVPQYATARFFAGIGLAGELGAGITLVSESLDKRSRGYATTFVATIGILGAVVAVLVGKVVTNWRTSYVIGGVLGLSLLLLRIGVLESGMYKKATEQNVGRGNFFKLFANWTTARRYLSIVAVGVPIWYAVGILVQFSPEIGAALGVVPKPATADAIMWTYIGLAAGDFASGALSQVLRSRKRAVGVFLLLAIIAVALYFTVGKSSRATFYGVCVFLGFATGYWAVFVTIAAEQFGTNLRATATTTAPNFVRSSVVPLTLMFTALKTNPSLGVPGAAAVVGVAALALSLVALAGLDETYGKDLDYVE